MEFKTYLEIGSYLLTAGVMAYITHRIKNRLLNKRAQKLGFESLEDITEKAVQKLKQEREGERKLVSYSGIITSAHPDEAEFDKLRVQIAAGNPVTFEVDTIEDPKILRATDTTALRTVLLLIKPAPERVQYVPAKLKLGRKISVQAFSNPDGTMDVKEYSTSIDAHTIEFLKTFAPHIYKNLSEEEIKRGKDLLDYVKQEKEHELSPVEHPNINKNILNKIASREQLDEGEKEEWEEYFETFGGLTANLIDYTKTRYNIQLPEENIRRSMQKEPTPLLSPPPEVPRPPEDTRRRRPKKR